MEESGVSIHHHTSIHIDDLPCEERDYIITVCDKQKEICPFISSNKAVRIHHSFEDPS